jgi:hypothetical protein
MQKKRERLRQNSGGLHQFLKDYAAAVSFPHQNASDPILFWCRYPESTVRWDVIKTWFETFCQGSWNVMLRFEKFVWKNLFWSYLSKENSVFDAVKSISVQNFMKNPNFFEILFFAHENLHIFWKSVKINILITLFKNWISRRSFFSLIWIRPSAIKFQSKIMFSLSKLKVKFKMIFPTWKKIFRKKFECHKKLPNFSCKIKKKSRKMDE